MYRLLGLHCRARETVQHDPVSSFPKGVKTPLILLNLNFKLLSTKFIADIHYCSYWHTTVEMV